MCPRPPALTQSDLIGCKLGRPAEPHTSSHGRDPAAAGALMDQRALELGDAGEHRQHHAARGRRRVCPRLGQASVIRPQPRSAFRQFQAGPWSSVRADRAVSRSPRLCRGAGRAFERVRVGRALPRTPSRRRCGDIQPPSTRHVAAANLGRQSRRGRSRSACRKSASERRSLATDFCDAKSSANTRVGVGGADVTIFATASRRC